MNPSRWREVNTLFHTLLDSSPEERERRQRIAGLGSFDDLRQLVLGGVR